MHSWGLGLNESLCIVMFVGCFLLFWLFRLRKLEIRSCISCAGYTSVEEIKQMPIYPKMTRYLS